jgi:hypothetical protein
MKQSLNAFLAWISGRRKPIAPKKPPSSTALNWHGVLFSYPTNWQLSPLDQSGSPSMGICLTTRGGSTFVLSRVAGTHRITQLGTAQATRINPTEYQRTHTWGGLQGIGFRMRGNLIGEESEVEVMIFIPHPPHSSIAITQFGPIADQANSASGFQLIQDSFSCASARRSQA